MEGKIPSTKMSNTSPEARQRGSSTLGLRKRVSSSSCSIHETTGLLHALLLLAKDKGTGITPPSDPGMLQPGSLGGGAAESFR